MTAPHDIRSRLGGPHEWGYRDPVEGGFIEDRTPFEAEDLISELLEALRDIERIARARHGSELEDAVFVIAATAGGAISKAGA